MEVKLESDAFVLDIKEEPLNTRDDMLQLQCKESNLLVKHNIKTEEQKYDVTDTQVEIEIIKKWMKIDSNGERLESIEKNVKSDNWMDKLLKCKVCEKIFNEKASFNSHMAEHGIRRSFGCKICKQRFIRKSHLRIHNMVEHNGHKPFECDICKIKFTRNSCLRSHMEIHNGTKPYQCEICKIRFALKCNLLLHMTIHNGTKPFECKMCKIGFTRQSTLKRHMKSQYGCKPFQCDFCKKRFIVKSALQQHMVAHKGNQCEICKNGYFLRNPFNCHDMIITTVNKHIVLIHQKENSLELHGDS